MTRGRLNNLVGKRFGRLLVLSRAASDKQNNARWSCSCDCGNEVLVRGSFLIHGQGFCGRTCPLNIERLTRNITGERFGRLVVLEPVKVGRLTKPIWRFKCDCGVTRDMRSYNVTSGDTKSCGCLGIESRIKHGQSRTREYHRLAGIKWAKANPARVIENTAKRQRALRDRIPKWLSETHRHEIDEIYRLAARRTQETGVEHDVDHIVPLRAKNVSGLHVPWNLQVITATENRRKGNRVLDEIC